MRTIESLEALKRANPRNHAGFSKMVGEYESLGGSSTGTA